MSGYTNAMSGASITSHWLTTSKIQIDFSFLVDFIDQLSADVSSKIAILRSKKSAMSIADMFDLQMAMQKLTQFSETSNSVIAAMNTSITSMARNMKG